MSGVLAFTGFGGAELVSDLFMAVGMLNLLRAIVLATKCSLL
jgi:hypothetical protein